MKQWVIQDSPSAYGRFQGGCMRVCTNRELGWRGNRLFPNGGGAIVPETQWKGMWRVRLPDGSLSDIVNIT